MPYEEGISVLGEPDGTVSEDNGFLEQLLLATTLTAILPSDLSASEAISSHPCASTKVQAHNVWVIEL